VTRQLTAAVVLICAIQGSAVGAITQAPANPDAQRLVEFKERLDAYITMRKKADDGAPALKETEKPSEIQNAQQSLAARVRSARAAAKQGDIFTPATTTHFRRLLRPELDKGTKDAIKEDNPGNFPFKVNDTYPEKEPRSTVPPNVLASLPELPKDQGIEYRFVNKHMILLDTRANLIIDYLPNAIP
jgi:hypothetical protein